MSVSAGPDLRPLHFLGGVFTIARMAAPVSYTTVAMQHRAGDRVGAEATLRALVTRRPDELCALLGLAEVLQDVSRRNPDSDEARFEARKFDERAQARRAALFDGLRGPEPAPSLEALEEASIVRRDDLTLLWDVAETCRATGQLKSAARAYRRYAVARPDDPRGYHLLAAVGGVKAPPRAEDDYVRALFDMEAGAYDEVEDRNLAAKLVAQAADDLFDRDPPPCGREGFRGLDLGCGTGRCGERVRPLLKKLRGTDLAPRLLRGARHRVCYDELAELELGAYLRKTRAKFELVCAADVFPWLGSLKPVLSGLKRKVVAGGYIIFTCEPGAEGATLEPTGRYTHAPSHITEIAEGQGYEVLALVSVELSRGTPRPGLMAILRSP